MNIQLGRLCGRKAKIASAIRNNGHLASSWETFDKTIRRDRQLETTGGEARIPDMSSASYGRYTTRNGHTKRNPAMATAIPIRPE